MLELGSAAAVSMFVFPNNAAEQGELQRERVQLNCCVRCVVYRRCPPRSAGRQVSVIGAASAVGRVGGKEDGPSGPTCPATLKEYLLESFTVPMLACRGIQQGVRMPAPRDRERRLRPYLSTKAWGVSGSSHRQLNADH